MPGLLRVLPQSRKRWIGRCLSTFRFGRRLVIPTGPAYSQGREADSRRAPRFMLRADW
jgi:hypothetical protein